MPFLSIIVPVYNTEPYLKMCLDSILRQDFVDFELILVNDGSTDNCSVICDEYAESDTRITVIHKANSGAVSARKAGLRVAKGQYVGYVDSDDWIEVDMYKSLCNTARIFDVDIVICDIIENYPLQEVKRSQLVAPGLYRKDRMEKEVYPIMLYSGEYYRFGLYPSLSNKIFKRDLLEKNLFDVDDQICMGDDAACTYPSLLDAESIYILENQYLYHYRQHSSSMTTSYDQLFFKKILVLYEHLKVLKYRKADQVPNFAEQLQYYFTYLVMAAVNNELNRFNHKRLHEKRTFIKKMLIHEAFHGSLHAIRVTNMPLKLKVYTWLLKKKQILLLFMLNRLNRQISDCKCLIPTFTKRKGAYQHEN
ncbi:MULTISPECIES: glycosyltransferase [Lysinibacillus]|uniref:glycosyltransferase n=1 Tax=Lysinibacillus TaxID=400634 RepID=UPI00237E060F|nr:glycosyltransferase [Lysinibacillus sp. G01H]UNT54545.1 glycosyltransferase [Lysinibacillus capsici]WDU80649.1 glycosyltransferase [Lysinibacillus sp. G01H]WHP39509.1 glycosyltransferase [Lysinibacillus boronitolerans]